MQRYPFPHSSIVPSLQCCREAAEKYPDIQYEEVIIDNACMMVSTFDATIEKNPVMIFKYSVG